MEYWLVSSRSGSQQDQDEMIKPLGLYHSAAAAQQAADQQQQRLPGLLEAYKQGQKALQAEWDALPATPEDPFRFRLPRAEWLKMQEKYPSEPPIEYIVTGPIPVK